MNKADRILDHSDKLKGIMDKVNTALKKNPEDYQAVKTGKTDLQKELQGDLSTFLHVAQMEPVKEAMQYKGLNSKLSQAYRALITWSEENFTIDTTDAFPMMKTKDGLSKVEPNKLFEALKKISV